MASLSCGRLRAIYEYTPSRPYSYHLVYSGSIYPKIFQGTGDGGTCCGGQWQPSFVAAFGMTDFRVMEMKWLEYARKLAPTDYRETIIRLEFLAKGIEALREKETFPNSFEQLAEDLRSIDFTYTSPLFGNVREMRAPDARLFEVPFAKDTASRPVFQLVDHRGRKLDDGESSAGKKKSVSKRKPPYPMIVTTGLEPRNVSVRWASVRRGKHQCVFAAE